MSCFFFHLNLRDLIGIWDDCPILHLRKRGLTNPINGFLTPENHSLKLLVIDVHNHPVSLHIRWTHVQWVQMHPALSLSPIISVRQKMRDSRYRTPCRILGKPTIFIKDDIVSRNLDFSWWWIKQSKCFLGIRVTDKFALEGSSSTGSEWGGSGGDAKPVSFTRFLG